MLAVELIAVETLVDRVREMHRRGCRLVQISATRLANEVELTYSFDLESKLENLRVLIPAAAARVPSISSVYWCAFIYENEVHDLFKVAVEGMAVDFQGHFYKTAVKFPFGRTKPVAAPPAAPAPAAAPVPAVKIVTAPVMEAAPVLR
jgi:ech hydrogenase subunit D